MCVSSSSYCTYVAIIFCSHGIYAIGSIRIILDIKNPESNTIFSKSFITSINALFPYFM